MHFAGRARGRRSDEVGVAAQAAAAAHGPGESARPGRTPALRRKSV